MLISAKGYPLSGDAPQPEKIVQAKTAGEESGTGSRAKIGFLLSTLQEERYKQDITFVRDESKRNGLDVLVEVSNNDSKIEKQKFESLLSKGVQVILFQANHTDRVHDLLEMAHREHVPVIAYDREIRSLPVDGSVIHDSKEIGVMQAKAALNSVHENLNVLILAGPAGQPVADDIVLGIESILKNNTRVKNFEVVHNDLWSPTRALAAVRTRLEKKNGKLPNVILASNSSMALGAVQAFKDWTEKDDKRAKLTRPFIAGADGDLSSLQALAKGQIQFEVLKDFRELAQKAVNMADEMVKELETKADAERFVHPQHVVLSVYAVDAANLDEILRKRHTFSHSEVYGEPVTKEKSKESNE